MGGGLKPVANCIFGRALRSAESDLAASLGVTRDGLCCFCTLVGFPRVHLQRWGGSSPV